jgi:hypothetical protein
LENSKNGFIFVLLINKNKMKKLIFLLGLVLLMSCQMNKPLNGKVVETNLVYFQDHRTGLCFAAIVKTHWFRQPEIVSMVPVPYESIKGILPTTRTIYPI